MYSFVRIDSNYQCLVRQVSNKDLYLLDRHLVGYIQPLCTSTYSSGVNEYVISNYLIIVDIAAGRPISFQHTSALDVSMYF